jgi:putative ABC transport system permease protein
MLRNYLAAALRNMARNKLYAGVTIVGLAIGFAAALLIGLYVRDELTYDRFVPGHDRVYQVTETLIIAGSAPIESASTPMMLARPLKLDSRRPTSRRRCGAATSSAASGSSTGAIPASSA